jgi:preprotein translocase subunit SecG
LCDCVERSGIDSGSSTALTKRYFVSEVPRFAMVYIYALVFLHVVVCLFLIGVVLLQQGKSADLAGAFGGQGSQTAFGPRGAANLFTRMTTWSAVLFMLTSVALTVMLSRHNADHSVLSGAGTTQSAPASTPKK